MGIVRWQSYNRFVLDAGLTDRNRSRPLLRNRTAINVVICSCVNSHYGELRPDDEKRKDRGNGESRVSVCRSILPSPEVTTTFLPIEISLLSEDSNRNVYLLQ